MELSSPNRRSSPPARPDLRPSPTPIRAEEQPRAGGLFHRGQHVKRLGYTRAIAGGLLRAGGVIFVIALLLMVYFAIALALLWYATKLIP